MMKIPVCVIFAGLISLTGILSASEDGNAETARIINGVEAAEGQFPFAAALFRNGRFICTSSIIGPTTVLTAAHCVRSNGRTGDAAEFHAIANRDQTSPEIRIDFRSVIPHPEYSESQLRNDIAVLRTTNAIPETSNSMPICLSGNGTANQRYRDATAIGWGLTDRNNQSSIPEILRFGEQGEISSLFCRIVFLGAFENTRICANRRDVMIFNTTGICNGDSGGPLIIYNENEPVQVGIASYGSRFAGCGTVVPSVWTRVSNFTEFIQGASENEACVI